MDIYQKNKDFRLKKKQRLHLLRLERLKWNRRANNVPTSIAHDTLKLKNRFSEILIWFWAKNFRQVRQNCILRVRGNFSEELSIRKTFFFEKLFDFIIFFEIRAKPLQILSENFWGIVVITLLTLFYESGWPIWAKTRFFFEKKSNSIKFFGHWAKNFQTLIQIFWTGLSKMHFRCLREYFKTIFYFLKKKIL